MYQRLLALALICSASAPLVAQESVPAPMPSPAVAPDSAAIITTGRKYTEWFYTDLGDSIIVHSSAQLREKVTPAQLSDVMGQILAQAGPEVSVISETVVPRDSLSAYLREARFEMMDEPLVLIFVLGSNGDVYGFRIIPKSQLPPEYSN